MSKADSNLDPSNWTAEYGDYLFSIAMSRLRNRDASEEVVQETFLAAIKAKAQYTGKGSEKSWLISILKNKIVDVFRKRSRQREEQTEADQTDLSETLFDRSGHWKLIADHSNISPDKQLQNEEFWKLLSECIESLPIKQQSVFSLRELQEKSSQDICSQLELTPSNLWVILHRARLQLANCLNQKWQT